MLWHTEFSGYLGVKPKQYSVSHLTLIHGKGNLSRPSSLTYFTDKEIKA